MYNLSIFLKNKTKYTIYTMSLTNKLYHTTTAMGFQSYCTMDDDDEHKKMSLV